MFCYVGFQFVALLEGGVRKEYLWLQSWCHQNLWIVWCQGEGGTISDSKHYFILFNFDHICSGDSPHPNEDNNYNNFDNNNKEDDKENDDDNDSSDNGNNKDD